MAEIKAREADAFVAAPDPRYRLFLVHGPDRGLVHERAGRLARGDGAVEVRRLDGDALAAEAGRLAEEAWSPSLFGERRALWIEAGQRALAPALEPLFAEPPQDCLVVVEAGELRKDAPLRALFERRPGAAAIACYPDGPGGVPALIAEAAAAAGASVDREARDLLVSLLGADRMASRAELAKLMLYAHGRERVTRADVEAIVTDAAPPVLARSIDSAFLGRDDELEALAVEIAGDRGGVEACFRTLRNHALTLHRVALGDANAARGGGQWSRQDAIAGQAKLWSAETLRRLLSEIDAAHAAARREARLGPAHALRCVWRVAAMARRGRRG